MVGADSVDSDAAEEGPLGTVVRRPCYHTSANRVRVSEKLLVDIVNVLPEVLCSSRAERRDRIEVSRNLKHPAPYCRKYSFHCFHDTVVE